MVFDLQVNGFAGVDFNSDDLTAESLHHACTEIRRHGADRILATVITDAVPAMETRLRRLAHLRAADPLARETIAGIHVEGPFLNETPGYIGAHPPEHARPATPDDAARLLEAADGLIRLVTLAPERDPGMATIRFLAERHVTVSAGHCDPSLDQLTAACDAGLAMFTHVGNGCPGTLPRHDNIIHRALHLADRLWLCFIADGAHIPFFVLAHYLRLAGPARAIAVTDAISAAALGPGRHRLGRWDLDIGDDLIAWGPNRAHLVGSTVTMTRTIANLRAIGLSDHDIRLMVELNPATAVPPSAA